MPYRYDVDRDAGVITKTVWGVYDDAQALQAIHDLAAIDGYEHFDELHDLLAVTDYAVSAAAIRRVAEASTQLLGSPSRANRVAMVVPGDLVHGMARMYEGFRSGEQEDLRIFRDLDAATAWLANGND